MFHRVSSVFKNNSNENSFEQFLIVTEESVLEILGSLDV